jgi:energy-coupling factor transport system ATP-binding protein
MDRNSAAKMRAKIGLIFQYPEDQLFEETVYKDIAFGLKKSALSESDKDFKIREAAKIVELDENLLDKSIYELSGGQKRKAAIAGVVVMEPGILILDEPAAGLDPAGRNEILNFTKRLRDEKGVSVILVSHSMEDIAAIADKVIVMNKGRIEMQGHPRDIFHHRERLEEIGLTIPQISKLFGELGKYVPGLFSDVLTVDEALNSIISYTGGCHY